jgi:hypothetical protein
VVSGKEGEGIGPDVRGEAKARRRREMADRGAARTPGRRGIGGTQRARWDGTATVGARSGGVCACGRAGSAGHVAGELCRGAYSEGLKCSGR